MPWETMRLYCLSTSLTVPFTSDRRPPGKVKERGQEPEAGSQKEPVHLSTHHLLIIHPSVYPSISVCLLGQLSIDRNKLFIYFPSSIHLLIY